jgi:hypothetical protein
VNSFALRRDALLKRIPSRHAGGRVEMCGGDINRHVLDESTLCIWLMRNHANSIRA